MKTVLPRYVVELQAPQLPVRQGTQGNGAKRVQEWLMLNDFTVAIDGDYGEGTGNQVRLFKQKGNVGNLPYDGTFVDQATWNVLSAPLSRAVVIDPRGDDFGENVVRVAKQYLAEKAREVGGDNRGVWERHFSRGRENQPWCQDFATTCWMDAARWLQLTETPFDLCDDNGVASSYVPFVADMAQRAGKLQHGTNQTPVAPGSMFFLKSANPSVPYSHVGIVIEDREEHIVTIEGNTNDGGSPNGYEVWERVRNRPTMDFGLT